MREHRVHGLRRRQPGVRAPDERAPHAPDHDRGRHHRPDLVPRGRRADGDVHGRSPNGDHDRDLRDRYRPTTTTGDSTTAAITLPSDFTATGALVDLWDSGWPTGRYYWTVVPVRAVTTTTGVQYYDAEVPQDACAAGRVGEFGKTSQPATTSQTSRPYVSGLSPNGELVAAQSATPSFYRAALVAWAPALGAIGYEVQWSKTKYPWKTASTTPYYTAATSLLLEGLATGTWYYRVRGIDPYIPGPVKQMTWSSPVRIRLIKPTFTVQDGSVTTRPVKK